MTDWDQTTLKENSSEIGHKKIPLVRNLEIGLQRIHSFPDQQPHDP